jgi:hypothetical protein
VPLRAAKALERVLVTSIYPLPVTRGLDPRVHLLRIKVDCRVKPGNDLEQRSAKYGLFLVARARNALRNDVLAAVHRDGLPGDVVRAGEKQHGVGDLFGRRAVA